MNPLRVEETLLLTGDPLTWGQKASSLLQSPVSLWSVYGLPVGPWGLAKDWYRAFIWELANRSVSDLEPGSQAFEFSIMIHISLKM